MISRFLRSDIKLQGQIFRCNRQTTLQMVFLFYLICTVSGKFNGTSEVYKFGPTPKFSTLAATTYTYSGAMQSITIPSGVTSMSATLYGASGADYSASFLGGKGAVIAATIPVTPGQVYQLFIGGAGNEMIAGFNGGGSGESSTSSFSRAGGGATDIRKSPFTLTDRIVVAGGGGGAAGNCATIGAGSGTGANAGYPSGLSPTGATCSGYVAPGGGTSSSGGSAGDQNCISTNAGSLGQGGPVCKNGGGSSYGGGGGGGYYGGGGAYGLPGAGGSSYSQYAPSLTTGLNTGDGYIVIEYFTSPTATPTYKPSLAPTLKPSVAPTCAPSNKPSASPTFSPTYSPTLKPTPLPSAMPTCNPTVKPTCAPTFNPTSAPTVKPTCAPTFNPTCAPTVKPTCAPTLIPTSTPTVKPTCAPTLIPTSLPTVKPTCAPTFNPTSAPTVSPTCDPTVKPSCVPTQAPTCAPTLTPTCAPTQTPTCAPTLKPTCVPTTSPTCSPTTRPTLVPTVHPTCMPTVLPTSQPSSSPSSQPSERPSCQPSSEPTAQPTVQPSAQPSEHPTSQPSTRPSAQPSGQPTAQPTGQPSVVPSTQPSSQPSDAPTAQPTGYPSSSPTTQPSAQPTSLPSGQPSVCPSSQPSGIPSTQPSSLPSAQPTGQPSDKPSRSPSSQPSVQPSANPSTQPTGQPSSNPSSQPTAFPSTQPSSVPSSQPSAEPSISPSSQPSGKPSAQPSTIPTAQPSDSPSAQPSSHPSAKPTSYPTMQPSSVPSAQPSSNPSEQPTSVPSTQPSAQPTNMPSAQPTSRPSGEPSSEPSTRPSGVPTAQPTSIPSCYPSAQPSSAPSSQPSDMPSTQPTSAPTLQPTEKPTAQPSSAPSSQPSDMPSTQPTSAPTSQPTEKPTAQPSSAPSSQPSDMPSTQPSSAPTSQPTGKPSAQPSSTPSGMPSALPSSQPSAVPSSHPSGEPSAQPSNQPSAMPSAQPSSRPSADPSVQPTSQPSESPSSAPSACPSRIPTTQPTVQPSTRPSGQPSAQPGSSPSAQPSREPSAHPSAQPSGQPSSHPTSMPTAYQSSRTIHSRSPSANPTQSPTLSELGSWTQTLQSALKTVGVDDSVAIVRRSTYYELEVASASPARAFGGCSAWSALVSGDINPSLYSFRAQSLSIKTITDRNSFDGIQELFSSDASCTDKEAVGRILSAMVAAPKAGSGSSAARSFACNGVNWVVQQCQISSTSYSAGICVGCSDPCASNLRCNRATSTSVLPSIAPCVQQVCPGTSSSASLSPATALRILSVGYKDIEMAPSIHSVATVAEKTSIKLTVQLSSVGSLYAAVYKSTAVVTGPSSTSAVQVQNLMATTNSANVSTLTIPNLEAATSYRVFFMTVSPIGVVSPLSDVLETQRTVATACCKTVLGDLSTATVREEQPVSNLLTIRLGALPSRTVNVQVSLSRVSSSTGVVSPSSASLFPAVFTVVSLSSTTILRASLPALPAGEYQYEISLSGPSKDEYQVLYANSNQRLQVISSVSEPPLPVLTSAGFSNDGAYISIVFNANTNRGGTSTFFMCNALFSFDCASTSRCQWIDSATVRAVIQSASSASVCVQPSSLLSHIGTNTKARCESASGVCSGFDNWKTVPVSEVTVQAPANPITPMVSISAPSVLGSCDDLVLDASSSTGSGGRIWASASVTVLSTQASLPASLNARLAVISSLTPPATLPSSLFTKGQTYNFKIRVCNFFGQCNVGSKQVLVLNDTLPSVSLPGPALRTVDRKSSLLVSSSAFMTICGGSRSSAGLSYKWTLSSNNIPVLTASSTSKDPSKFLLPAFSLIPDTMYQLTLSVSSLGSAQSAVVSAQVFVQPGNIVASIQGSSLRSLRVTDMLALSASLSYDEDQYRVTGSAAGLRFSWNCAQTAPSFNSTCSNMFHAEMMTKSASEEAFVIVPQAGSAGATASITVEVSDNSGRPSARATVTVTVLPELAPRVIVTAAGLPTSGIVNAGQSLQLKGEFSVPATFGGNATWMVDDSSIDLHSIALFPVTVRLPAVKSATATAISSITSYMAFAANSLPSGAALTFSLVGTMPLQGKRAIASVSVTVNAPPSSGGFYVDPSEGVELQQNFQFIALQWVDPDLPISYEFGYTTVTGIRVVLRSRLQLAYGTSLLPAGDAEKDNQVVCLAQIFDSLNANTSSSFAARVTKESEFSSSQVADFVAARFDGTDSDTDADSIKQAMALSNYLLNAANCTLAPDCAALNRKGCASTAHTCGECVSDEYVGESGDSNEACLLEATAAKLFIGIGSSAARLSTSDMTKRCAANCSGHGSCYHVWRDSQQIIPPEDPPCLSGADNCVAVCDCEPEFYGSDTCDLSTEDFQARQSSRAAVLTGLERLVALENADEQVVSGWANSISQVCQVSSELTGDSALSVLNIVDIITSTTNDLQTSSSSQISLESLSGLLKAIDAVAASRTKSNIRRRLNERRQLSHQPSNVTSSADVVDAQTTEKVLKNFGALVAKSMLPGQSAGNFSQSEFRMSVQVLTDEGKQGRNVTVAIPQTAAEKLQGKEASQVVVPSAEGVSLVTTAMRSAQYQDMAGGERFQTNPVSLYSPGWDLCAGNSSCTLEITLQYSSTVDFDALNSVSEEYKILSCDAGDMHEQSFTCSNGEIMLLACSGEAATVKRRCPVISYSAVCNSLSAGMHSIIEGDESGCAPSAYSDTSVTCACNVSATPADSRISTGSKVGVRRLQASSVGSRNFTEPAGYSVSYVGMLQASSETFLSTISTADNLNASNVAKGWRALATLGALAAAIVVGLLWSHHADFKMKKISPTDDDERSAVTHTSAKTRALADAKAAKRLTSYARRVKFNTRAKKALVNAELAVVEESLPRALSSRTFSDRFLEEVKQHHRWVGIVFYYSDAFPRVLRVMSLATNAIVMLFIQSITYNLTNPDTGACAAFTTEAECVQPKSPFSTGESMCAWVQSSSTSSAECVYIEPDNSIRIILFVAIFCAIVTTPIALTADWVMLNILCAPTQQQQGEEDKSAAETALATVPGDSLLVRDDAHKTDADGFTGVMMSSGSGAGGQRGVLRRSGRSTYQLRSYLGMTVFNDEAKMKADKVVMASCRAELMMLSMKLKKYRETLRADEIEEFNILWGLNANGSFMTGENSAGVNEKGLYNRIRSKFFKKKGVDVKEAVLMDLKRIHDTVRDEAAALKETQAAKYEIGRKLLFLFQCDLLPGISGKILELKGNRDSSAVKHVSYSAKVVGWSVLILMDVGMLFYILLFALTQTGPRQNAWFQSFALWLVVEILLVSTMIVLITHILIPSLIMKDITQIKRRLMDNIRDFNDKVSSGDSTQLAKRESNNSTSSTSMTTQEISFNAANFLFVSTRLAKQFPDLKESKIISQFSTPWPRQSYLHVQNVSKKYSKKFSAFTRSASILLIFFVGNFLSVPPSVQDIIVQMTSTTAIGYIVLIHVQLFEIFPALVILPALVLAVLAHFIVQSGKADAKIKLARLFPANNKKHKVGQDPMSGETVSIDESAPHQVVEEDECNGHDSDSDMEEEKSDAIGTTAVAAVPLSHEQSHHRTRRQSIQSGLDLLHVAHNHHQYRDARSRTSQHRSNSAQSSTSSSDSDDSDSESGSELEEEEEEEVKVRGMPSHSGLVSSTSDGDAGDSMDMIESLQLHTAMGSPISGVRTLQRKAIVQHQRMSPTAALTSPHNTANITAPSSSSSDSGDDAQAEGSSSSSSRSSSFSTSEYTSNTDSKLDSEGAQRNSRCGVHVLLSTAPRVPANLYPAGLSAPETDIHTQTHSHLPSSSSSSSLSGSKLSDSQHSQHDVNLTMVTDAAAVIANEEDNIDNGVDTESEGVQEFSSVSSHSPKHAPRILTSSHLAPILNDSDSDGDDDGDDDGNNDEELAPVAATTQLSDCADTQPLQQQHFEIELDEALLESDSFEGSSSGGESGDVGVIQKSVQQNCEAAAADFTESNGIINLVLPEYTDDKKVIGKSADISECEGEGMRYSIGSDDDDDDGWSNISSMDEEDYETNAMTAIAPALPSAIVAKAAERAKTKLPNTTTNTTNNTNNTSSSSRSGRLAGVEPQQKSSPKAPFTPKPSASTRTSAQTTTPPVVGTDSVNTKATTTVRRNRGGAFISRGPAAQEKK